MLSPMPSALSEPSERSAEPDGITVLGVQFASIRSLFAPMRDRAKLMFIHLNDWLNVARCKLNSDAFVQMEALAGVDWREWRYPPGWANRLAPWIMPNVAARVERAWRARGWRNPRLVVTFPYFLPAVRALGAERVIYYAVDNYQAYWPDRAAAICERENELIREAAASVAASSALANWFRERVPEAAAKIHYLPNGISPAMIPAAVVTNAVDDNRAQRFGQTNGPVVGCYGNIASGYGVEFLADVVERAPDFRFLLMGQVLSETNPSYRQAIAYLKKRPNVVMTGRLEEPASLQFLCQCDVMIVPLPLTDQVRYSCPNRLWTYMATGRPIVSTPIPEVTKFGELIYAATNIDEFVHALRCAAQENNPSMTEKRIAIAKQHTWPVLAQRMWSILSAAN